MIENTINAISNSFKETYIPYYVVMPNHVHLLIGNNGQHYIPEMMRWFKNITTNKYIKGVKELGWKSFNKKLWQRNYYDHIIRTQKSYNFIVDYIETNPLKWADDQFYIQ